MTLAPPDFHSQSEPGSPSDEAAALREVIAVLQRHITAQTARIGELERRLGLNSTNSGNGIKLANAMIARISQEADWSAGSRAGDGGAWSVDMVPGRAVDAGFAAVPTKPGPARGYFVAACATIRSKIGSISRAILSNASA